MDGRPPPPSPRGFRLAGVPVRVQPTFLLIVVFLAMAPGRSAALAIAWVAVITASILVHEAGHAIAFRRFGVAVAGGRHLQVAQCIEGHGVFAPGLQGGNRLPPSRDNRPSGSGWPAAEPVRPPL